MKILKNLFFVICILSNLQDMLYAMEGIDEINQEIVTLDEEIHRLQAYISHNEPATEPIKENKLKPRNLSEMFFYEKCNLIQKLRNEKTELVSKINQTPCLISLKLNITDVDKEIITLDKEINSMELKYHALSSDGLMLETLYITIYPLDIMSLNEKCNLIQKLRNKKAELVSNITIAQEIINLDIEIHNEKLKYDALISNKPKSKVLYLPSYPFDKMSLEEKDKLIQKLRKEKAELVSKINQTPCLISLKLSDVNKEIIILDEEIHRKKLKYRELRSGGFILETSYKKTIRTIHPLDTMSLEEKNKLIQKLRNERAELVAKIKKIKYLISLKLSDVDKKLTRFCDDNQMGTFVINSNQSYSTRILSMLNPAKLLFYYPLGWKTDWHNHYKNIKFISPSEKMVELGPFILDIENEIKKQLTKIEIPENHRIKITQKITSNNIFSPFWPHDYNVEIKDDLVIHNIKIDPNSTSLDPEIQKFLIAKLMIQPTKNLSDNARKLLTYKLFCGSFGALALGCTAYFISHNTNSAPNTLFSCITGGLAGIKMAVKYFEKKEIEKINKQAKKVSGVSEKTAKRAQDIKPSIKKVWDMKSQKGENIKVLEIIPFIPEE